MGTLEEDARLTALFLWTLQSTNGNDDPSTSLKAGAETGGHGDAEKTENDEDEEENPSAKSKRAGFTLVYDIARRFAQPLGIHLDDWRGRIIEMDKGIVRLLSVTERAEQLFGEEGAERIAEALIKSRVTDLQMSLFPDGSTSLTTGSSAAPQVERSEIHRMRGRRNPNRDRTDSRGRARPVAVGREPTTLDRLHAAMLLQSSGQSVALRAMLQQEVDRTPDFLRLANALSALYPRDSEEKRLLDGMLLAVPR